jgi:hypothetical protein
MREELFFIMLFPCVEHVFLALKGVLPYAHSQVSSAFNLRSPVRRRLGGNCASCSISVWRDFLRDQLNTWVIKVFTTRVFFVPIATRAKTK